MERIVVGGYYSCGIVVSDEMTPGMTTGQNQGGGWL